MSALCFMGIMLAEIRGIASLLGNIQKMKDGPGLNGHETGLLLPDRRI